MLGADGIKGVYKVSGRVRVLCGGFGCYNQGVRDPRAQAGDTPLIPALIVSLGEINPGAIGDTP